MLNITASTSVYLDLYPICILKNYEIFIVKITMHAYFFHVLVYESLFFNKNLWKQIL